MHTQMIPGCVLREPSGSGDLWELADAGFLTTGTYGVIVDRGTGMQHLHISTTDSLLLVLPVPVGWN